MASANRFHRVEVEHAPVWFVMLAEFGGRSEAANRVIGESVSSAGHQLVEVLPKEDGLVFWKYNNKVEQVVDFLQERNSFDHLFFTLGNPPFSETNLYDAILLSVDRMRPINGRKAVLLVSSGVDQQIAALAHTRNHENWSRVSR